MFTLPSNIYPSATQSYAWGSDMYRSPHASYSAADTPQGWRNILLWCQHVYCNNGTYKMAMDRIVSYFITELDVGAAGAEDMLGDDDKEKWETLVGPQLDVPGHNRRLNLDGKCYGSGFASIHVPFRRHLTCPRCHAVYPFKEVTENPRFEFAFVDFEFTAKCPNSECRFKGVFNTWDEPELQPDKLSIKHWSPLEMELQHDLASDDVAYLWRIPEDYKMQIRSGKTFHLERVPRQVLEAIKYNQLYRFKPGVIYHYREHGPTGVRNRGWGLSPLLYNSRMVWYVELLHRYNEAIALDYVVPLRVVTPDLKSGPGGVGNYDNLLRGSDLGDVNAQLQRMIRFHRRNPTSWHTLPFPVQFQQLSGDATRLAPSELLNQGYDTLLNAAGTPVELYKGTLQLQVAPVALRLFESTHHNQVYSNNDFADWVVKRTSQILNWEPVTARYRRVAVADDMQKQMMILQMVMGGRISETEGLRILGLDWRDQRRQIAEEARYDQVLQARLQEEMDQAAYGQQVAKGMPMQGGMPGQPGMPMQPGMQPGMPGGQAGGQIATDPNTGQPVGSLTSMIPSMDTPMTPQSMMEAASAIASQMLGLPSTQRHSELQQLRQKNEMLHRLVRMELEKIRGNARSQGGSAVLQQTFGAA